MNWKYFIGCKAKDNDGNIGTVTSLDFGTNHIYVDHIMESDDGWKPILRPLSSMTDEEKREFVKIKELTIKKYHDDRTPITTETKRDLTFVEGLWLMEKGFFVGQCREDECILEG